MAKFLIREQGEFLEAEAKYVEDPRDPGCSWRDSVEIVQSGEKVDLENLLHFGTEPLSFKLRRNGNCELI